MGDFTLEPKKDWLLLSPRRETTIKTSLLLPQNTNDIEEERIATYQIIKVGEEVESVHPGDEVVLYGVDGRKFEIEGESYFCAREEDVAFVVKQKQ